VPAKVCHQVLTDGRPSTVRRACERPRFGWLSACADVVFLARVAKAAAASGGPGEGRKGGAGGNLGRTLAAVGRGAPVVSPRPESESANGRPLGAGGRGAVAGQRNHLGAACCRVRPVAGARLLGHVIAGCHTRRATVCVSCQCCGDCNASQLISGR
jgi:hypothetical protein